MNPASDMSTQGTWVCTHCHSEQVLKRRGGRHPFGRAVCQFCDKPPNIQTDRQGEVVTLAGLESLPGREYKVSLPPDQLTAPETKFCWICCSCGVSHIDTPEILAASTPVDPDFKPDFLSRSTSILRRVNSLRHPFSHKGKDKAEDDVGTRTVYRQTFDHKCTRDCKHRACETCFRGVWKVEVEWVVRVLGDEHLSLRRLEFETRRRERDRNRDRDRDLG